MISEKFAQTLFKIKVLTLDLDDQLTHIQTMESDFDRSNPESALAKVVIQNIDDEHKQLENIIAMLKETVNSLNIV